MSWRRNRLRAFLAVLLASVIASAFGLDVYALGNKVINRDKASLVIYSHLALKKIKKKGFVTAELAAQRLYQAWHKGNRSAALRVASSEAVNKLFKEKWRPMKPGKNFCQNRGNGITCLYHDGKSGVLEMEIDGGVSVGGYNVTSVSLFSAAD
jgi:polyferredoxin